ncbi:disulfide bond formation protein B [Chitinimonas arctica]|uniref:Disulfide bond formation protein B n=1 Tax=Chitinimonas arctica TaxID=2594795 RepID=A0A516SKC5_9NEIS|nr:disulfide bond formation protein B [Chitinimonas arctica]QDQ28612.1 disulfide bond formation protein B [Chitinimonas arctica]
MTQLNYRIGFLAISLACAGMMGFALYLQHYQYLNPCPLCMFQRVFVVAVGAVALLGALHGPGVWRHRVYAGLCALLGLAGLGVAVRHTVLQYWPPEYLPSCGAGVFQMLEKSPWGEVAVTVLKGSGECAIIEWRLLGLSLPGWTGLCFAGLVVAAILLARKRKP